MATNVSYASADTNLESLILHILPDFGEHGDGIVNSNLLTAALKQKGATENVQGGLEFWYGIMKNETSNAKWQGKNDELSSYWKGISSCVTRISVNIQRWTRPKREIIGTTLERLTRATRTVGYTVCSTAII